MGEERTHEVAGTVFCGTRLPAEPPGNPKPHAPAALRPAVCRGWSGIRRLARPSDPGALLARKTAVSRPAGVFWMRGASICGAGASAQLEERWQEVCVGGCWRVRSCRPPRQPRSAWTGVWEDAVLPTRMCGATPPKRFRGSSADSRKGVKFGFRCLWLSRFLPPEPLLLCLQTALFGACRGPRGVRRGPRRPLAQRRGHRGRRCHHRRHWLAPRPLDSHAITRWVP